MYKLYTTTSANQSQPGIPPALSSFCIWSTYLEHRSIAKKYLVYSCIFISDKCIYHENS